MMSEKSAEQRPTLEQTISLGHRRLHPLLRDSNYLSLIERRKRFAEAVKQVPGNSLRVLDVGGRIQPYRPLLDGRLEAYIAVDLQRTELVDVLAVGERLPFAEGVFDVVLCSQMLCYAEDAPKVIDEIYSVLRPGGALLLSVPAILPYHAENEVFPQRLALAAITLFPGRRESGGIFAPGSLPRCRTFRRFVWREHSTPETGSLYSHSSHQPGWKAIR